MSQGDNGPPTLNSSSLEGKQPQKSKTSLRPQKAHVSQELTASARQDGFNEYSSLALKSHNLSITRKTFCGEDSQLALTWPRRCYKHPLPRTERQQDYYMMLSSSVPQLCLNLAQPQNREMQTCSLALNTCFHSK